MYKKLRLPELLDFNQNSLKTVLATVSVFVASLYVSHAMAASNYSEGVSSYIKGDYERAKNFWLKAADNNNARAMFNLGLLHDQGKILNADSDKARLWFKVAGQKGYASADYFYANRLTEQRAPMSEIVKHLQRAVDNGSYPASVMLAELMAGENPPQLAQAPASTLFNEAFLAADQSEKGGPVAAQQKIARYLKIEHYLREPWILSKDATAWTIQLLAFREHAKLKKFVDEHRLHSSAAYFVEKTEQGPLYKLLYGVYENKDLAAHARNALSRGLKQHDPWLRSIGGVQSIIANQ